MLFECLLVVLLGLCDMVFVICVVECLVMFYVSDML